MRIAVFLVPFEGWNAGTVLAGGLIMYAKYIKRLLDFLLSLIGIVILSPLLIILIVVGAIFMGGNPFFTQERPGRNEQIFKLIKFRTMDNRKDAEGKLLPDEDRLNKYGAFLRKTSLDELPEMINILKGDMALIGPRPLLVEYLPWYTEEEKHRHDVRPGLTGLAQVNGRNFVNWDRRLQYDIEYVSNISIKNDINIFFKTISRIVSQSDISVDSSKVEPSFAEEREGKLKT